MKKPVSTASTVAGVVNRTVGDKAKAPNALTPKKPVKVKGNMKS